MVEAGYPNGINIDMGCRTSQQELTECEAYQQMMKAAGINISIKPMNANDFVGPNGFIAKIGFGPLRWTPRADPHIVLNWLGNSQNTAYPYRASYKNAELDKLLEEGGQTYDIAKAKPIYDRIQEILATEAPYIYIVWRQEYTAYSGKTRNFVWTPDNFQRLRNIWLEQ